MNSLFQHLIIKLFGKWHACSLFFQETFTFFTFDVHTFKVLCVIFMMIIPIFKPYFRITPVLIWILIIFTKIQWMYLLIRMIYFIEKFNMGLQVYTSFEADLYGIVRSTFGRSNFRSHCPVRSLKWIDGFKDLEKNRWLSRWLSRSGNVEKFLLSRSSDFTDVIFALWNK